MDDDTTAAEAREQLAASMRELAERFQLLTVDQQRSAGRLTRTMHAYFEGVRGPTLRNVEGAYDQDLELSGAVITGLVALGDDMMCTLTGESGWVDQNLTCEPTVLNPGAEANVTAGGGKGRGADLTAVLSEWERADARVTLRGFRTPPLFTIENDGTGDTLLVVRSVLN